MRFAILVAAALILGSCTKSDSTGPSSQNSISATITSIQTSTGVAATLYSGATPSSSNGPSASVPANVSVINGGTSTISVTSSGSMTRIAISMPGADGYYELILPGSSTSAILLLSLAQSVSVASLELYFQAGTSSGYGATAPAFATVTHVGTGDVQVSVSWSVPADVDLHVVDPSGTEIYWGNRTSASGGSLDLDSNAACSIDNVDNENITWPTGSSPSGSYTVRVDYWNSCGVAVTNYVVTVNVSGRTPQVYTGSFTGSGDEGGRGAGRLITTFSK